MHDADEDADSAALGKLSEALGEPSREAAENAKALFPFIALAAAMDDEGIHDEAIDNDAVGNDAIDNEAMDGKESLAALEGRPSDSLIVSE
ncbi:hypothetical protein AB0M97_02930 [Streptomyces sp. NPDC051207]|uniref:hypothetical protein n=1 Tax=Streptomyces sp. NPDC051207 TaxID=3154641 RepID=UPI00343E6295